MQGASLEPTGRRDYHVKKGISHFSNANYAFPATTTLLPGSGSRAPELESGQKFPSSITEKFLLKNRSVSSEFWAHVLAIVFVIRGDTIENRKVLAIFSTRDAKGRPNFFGF